MITATAIIAPVIIVISLDFCFKIVYDIVNLILSHFYCTAFIKFSTIASRILALSYDTPHFSILFFKGSAIRSPSITQGGGKQEKEGKKKKCKNLQRKNKNKYDSEICKL